MKDGLEIKNGIIIPANELEISTSRSGGKGGQHVNKTETKITVRWNVKNSVSLDEIKKERIMSNLQAKLTKDGDLIVHNSESRSQQQNRTNALNILAQIVRKALYVPKKRIKTRTPKKEKEKRLREKKHRSEIKKMRSKKFDA